MGVVQTVHSSGPPQHLQYQPRRLQGVLISSLFVVNSLLAIDLLSKLRCSHEHLLRQSRVLGHDVRDFLKVMKTTHFYVLSSSVILSRIVGDLHSSLLESGMNKDDENVVERDNDDKNSKHVVQNGTSREENRTQASRSNTGN